MQGETITVKLRDGRVETQNNVLVVPKARIDMNTINTSQEICAYTLHFPKRCTFLEALRGARIEVRGETYRVLGNPKKYMEANTPTEWIMPVDVARLGYDHQITIQAGTQTTNEKGDSTTTWEDVLTAGSSAIILEEKEETQASRISTQSTVLFTLDWDDELKGLTPSNSRIVWNGEVFDITSLNNVGFTCDIVKIKAVSKS